jgi:hypothetical protein
MTPHAYDHGAPQGHDPGAPQGHDPGGAPDLGPGSTRMDRRTFLTRTAEVGLVVGAVGVAGYRLLHRDRPWNPAAFRPPGEARVAVLSARTYDAGLEHSVFDGLTAIGADVRGANVVLKPNLVEFDPGTSVNTDPRLVAATVLALRRLGAANVTAAEGPGHRRDTQYLVSRSGLMDALQAVDAPFVDLNADVLLARRLQSRFT